MPRVLAALVVAAVALGALTACGQSVGSEAEQWLLSHDIVESVDTSGHYDGFTFMPSTAAELAPTASAADVRELSVDASAYLADRGTLNIALSVGEFSIDVPREAGPAGDAADLWSTARSDERVSSGRFRGVEATLATPRDGLAAVFADYVTALDLLEVASDESEFYAAFRLSGSAHCFDAAADSAAVLLADSAIAAADIDLCGEGRVVTSSADEVLPTAERLAPLLAATPVAITVVYDDDQNLWFQTASRELPLALVTPELLSLLRGVEVREPLVLRVEPDGRVFVEVDLNDLRPAVTSILRDPSISAAPTLLVRAANVSVQSLDLTEANAFLDLAEGFIALDIGSGYFAADTGEVRYIVLDDDLTEANGKRLVDLALSNDLWRTGTVAIVDYSGAGVVFFEGSVIQSDGDLGAALADYWAASI